MRTMLNLLFISCLPLLLQAQESIRWSKVNGYENKIAFEATGIPELQPIPGERHKPKAKFLWLFGDGNYSFDDAPVHIYNSVQYTPYEAELFATYTYTDTGTSNRKHAKSSIAFNSGGNRTTGSSPSDANPFKGRKFSKKSVRVQTNQEAKAGENFVAILSYKNTTSETIDGKLDFYYNQESSCSECFSIEQSPRMYNGETRQTLGMLELWGNALASLYPMPDLVTEKVEEEAGENDFAGKEVFEFTNFQPGEVRNIFVVLKTNEAMTDTTVRTEVMLRLRDQTNRVLDERFPLEIQLVSSHDPNNILAANNRGRMNRKFMLPWKKNEPIKFQINFQNNGNGPAKKIKIISDISRKMDFTSLKVLDARIGRSSNLVSEKDSFFYYKAYPDSLVFNFEGISLAGTGEKGRRKKDTKGSVTYTIKTGKKAPKVIKSRANIYFDSNENVITKRSKVRLKKAARFTLELGAVFPSKPLVKWKVADLTPAFDNKYLCLGISRLMPTQLISMDVGIKYSRTAYVFDTDEPGVEESIYRFNHLTANLTPQIDLLPFLRVGLDLEGGVLVSANQFNNRTFFLLGEQPDTFSALRYGGALKILFGRTQKNGLALGASYFVFREKTPVHLTAAGISEFQWNDGFRVFLRYKI